MLVSMKWLKNFVEVPDEMQDFCDRLDLTGTGVEGIETIGASLDGVVVGEVLTCVDHPDSDHMHLTTVNIGAEEPVQIVCGAPNVCAGIKVPVATIGTVMPSGIKIKKSKLRGQLSCGMICSARELEMGQEADGIWVLPQDAPVGVAFAQYKGLSDQVLDLEITPNRPDCLSMKGFAREVGAIYNIPWHYESPCKVPGPLNTEDVSNLVNVEITEPVLCPRYTAKIIRDVKIGPSPQWLVERITALGARSINNVVDATNYILFELGQPLHAFDLRAFPKGDDGKHHVKVCPAKDGQEFITLDGEKRKLTNDMTLITNDTDAVALAGVMGGLDSEVKDDTTDILLESATFSTAHTSRTSRNLSLVSESSLRYERGVDANTCAENAEIAAALIASISGGTVCSGIVDEYPIEAKPVKLTLRPKRLRAHIGADITDEEQITILKNLGCEVTGKAGDEQLQVIAPTFRPDLIREIDLYEEVLRIWGMDRVESTLPGGTKVGGRNKDQQRIELMSKTLRACGLNETMTYSLVSAQDLELARMPQGERGEAVELINPMSSEQSVMRRSIIPGLLRSVAYNASRGVKNVQLFERGVVFGTADGRKTPKELSLIAGVLTGSFHEKAWNVSESKIDFYDAKGVVETLLHELCTQKVRFKAFSVDEAPWLQPGRGAQILSGGCVLGWVGEIHPLSCKAFDIDESVVGFELDVKQLLSTAQDQRPYVDVPTYPGIEMDLALVVDEDVAAERISSVITKAGKQLLEKVSLFDVYRDVLRVGKDKKSMAYRLVYRAPDRTLTTEEVEQLHARIVKKVCAACNAQVRS